MSGCMFQVYEAREENRKVFQALLLYWSTTLCSQCVVTDENQTFETDLGSRLVHVSDITNGFSLIQGSLSTVTMIPCNIHLHKIVSQCRPVLQ
jgi:hypothetical protein